MSLHQFITKDEIRQFVKFFTVDDGKSFSNTFEYVYSLDSDNDAPQNQIFLNVTKFVLDDIWPKTASKLRFYCFPHDCPVYFFIVDENPLLFPFIVVRSPTSGHKIDLIHQVFPLLLKEIEDFLNKSGRFLLDAELPIKKEVISLYCSGEHPIFSTDLDDDLNSNIFYMNASQLRKVKESKVVLPDGYELTEVNDGEESDRLHSLWTYACSNDITRQRIQHLPYAAIRSSNGEIVAWELTHNLGMLMYLHCLPEYRERGLGTAVEMRLAQTHLSKGFRVVKHVETENTRVHNGTLRHPIWSVWKRDDIPVEWTNSIFNKI